MKAPSATVSLSPGWVGTQCQAVLGSRPVPDISMEASYLCGLNFLSPPRLGLCPTVKHDWAFQDRDTQFYRFPGPEPEPVGAHELEEELVEALALLSQRGPDALLTVALRKP